MAEAKIHPPSDARIADARASGLSPRPLLLGLAAVSLTLALFVHVSAAELWRGLIALLRTPLDALARGDRGAASAAAWALARQLGWRLVLFGVCSWACVALLSSIAQGPHFGWPDRRPRPRFEAPKPSRTACALACLLLPTLSALTLPALSGLQPAQLASVLSGWVTRLSLLLLALALVDVAFARAQFFRALWLTRREQRDAQREAYGSAELRGARRARRLQDAREERT